MEYAQYTFSGWYKQFIQGFFAAHAQPIVLTIATGQALIALGMLTRGPVFKLAAIGAILFLVAIAPLGVGSAFPCTLVMAVAMWQLFRRGSREWLWQAFRQTA